MTETKVPAIYGAILAVMNELGVDKNGTLPSQMGGKGYVTASDLSSEVKKAFVKHGIVGFPREREVAKEIIIFKERLNIAITVETTYKLVSTVDGSTEEVSGVGDGLATGTAVSANIASTNALKNVLMRLLLITEQSVEDQGKEEPKVTRAQQAVAKASKPASSEPTVDSLKADIRKRFIDTGLKTTAQIAVLSKAETAKGIIGTQVYQNVIAALTSEKE